MTKILDVGCGQRKRKGAVGIDILEDSAADIVHDLNTFPWPIQDNEFDVIYATHVLEHLENIIKTMEEIHRIGKNRARVIIDVPHFTSRGAFTDPTHRNFFGYQTMRYFDATTPEGALGYSKANLKANSIFMGRYSGQVKPDWKNPLSAVLTVFINRVPGWYESYFCHLFPSHNIHYELQVIK